MRRGRLGKVKGGFEHSERVRFTWSREIKRRPEQPERQGSHEVHSNVPVLKHDKKKGSSKIDNFVERRASSSTFLRLGREQRQTLFVKSSIIQSDSMRDQRLAHPLLTSHAMREVVADLKEQMGVTNETSATIAPFSWDGP